MCDNDDMDEGEYDFSYEYEDDGDEQQTDGDYDEYDYENDDMKDNGYLQRSTTKEMQLGVVPDGTFILKEYSEIYSIMDAIENNVSTLLNVDRDSAELLLQACRWDSERLVERFFANSDKIMSEAGIQLHHPETIAERIALHKNSMTTSDHSSSSSSSSLVTQLSSSTTTSAITTTSPILSCRICGDEFTPAQGFAMCCNHWFCKTCYTEYLKTQVGDGPICIHTKCPEYKCGQAISRSVFELFLPEEILAKYRMYVTRNFIDNSKNMKYCPSSECTKVAIGSGVTRIHCTCSKPYCFRCGEEAHDPCSCSQLVIWRTKCQDESETANWILANTKKCPQCRTRIEKNQGCNHMTCKICKFEFCWICNGVWADHGQTTGGYYKCNRFEVVSSDSGKSAADKAKAELDKYLHYYQRFHAHDVSLKFASQQRESAEQKMLEQQEVHKSSWIDVQFVRQAVELVIECRRVLKFTYALGFFLNDDPGKQLFEHHQEMLEKNTERLQEYTEEPLDKMDRTNIVNLTRVTEKFLESMLASASNELINTFNDGTMKSDSLKIDTSANESATATSSAPSSVRSTAHSATSKQTTRVTRSSSSKSTTSGNTSTITTSTSTGRR